MTLLVGTVFGVLLIAQIVLPRKYAFLPLILAAAHMGDAEMLPQITPARGLILIGLMRAFASGYFKGFKRTKLDSLMALFSVIALASSVGHEPDIYFPSPVLARLGLVFNVVGAYAYGRAYLPDLGAFVRYATLLPILLIPLAFGMLSEQTTRVNVYYPLGARSPESLMRLGKIRASGPFDHPILAGTCGATVLPFAYLLYRRNQRGLAVVAVITCMTIVLCTASSGPLAAVAISILAIFLWKWRTRLRNLGYGALAFGLVYWVVKGRGPWFLMASLDLVGGSTGWHRARLIDQSFVFLDEWWLWGSDYTRHWMSSGTRWNPNVVDMTNYYLHLGVTGGIGLSIILICFIGASFNMLGRRMQQMREVGSDNEIVLWCAGVALAAHAMSFVSISYFDQMYVFFYILVGSVPGLVATDSEEELLLSDEAELQSA